MTSSVPLKSAKNPSRSKTVIRSHGNPGGEIRRKPSTKQLAQPTANEPEEPARRHNSFTGAASEHPTNASRTSRVSRSSRASRASLKQSVSEKGTAPTHYNNTASATSALRRSVAIAASRRSRTSSGARDRSGTSNSTRRHRRSKRGGRRTELGRERDDSLASVVSLAGDIRGSVTSSKRSLRSIGAEDDGSHKRKVLQMPDGTYVGLREKNRWLRAMQEKYRRWDCMACTLKTGFSVTLLGFAYLLVFHQDLLFQWAVFVRDNVYGTESTAGTIYKRKYENITAAGRHFNAAGAIEPPQAMEVERQNIRSNHELLPQGSDFK